MSRILVKEDLSGEEHLVPYWISQKGNLCWRIGEIVYVKMKSGFTMMLETPDSNKWIPSNCHTKAKTSQVAAATVAEQRNDMRALTMF